MSEQTKLRQRSRLLFAPIALSLALFSLTETARADEIAVWNFNDSDLVVDHGSGTLTTNFNLTNIVFNLGGTTLNARQGDAAGQSATLQGGTGLANNGRWLTVNVSTVGFTNIVFSFATQATSTGFNSNQVQYSLDGVNFVDFGAPYSPSATFTLVAFDLSSITGLNNNPNAALRIVFNGATTSTGNNRIDNLVIEGQNAVVPEPASLLLFGMGLTGTAAVLRSKRSRRKKGWIDIRD
jgi:hypothetical protein